MIIRTIKNPIILKIPISFMSFTISLILNASFKDSYLANLHIPTVLKIPNIKNRTIATIAVIARPDAKLDQAAGGMAFIATSGDVALAIVSKPFLPMVLQQSI